MAKQQQMAAEIKTSRYKFRGNEFQGRNSTTTKDQRLTNCYVETIEKFAYDAERRVVIVKRPGIELAYNSGGVGRGIWAFNGSIYYVCSNIVYKDGVATGTVLTTSTGYVGRTACTIEGAAAMFFCDGISGYVIDDTHTITQVASAGFPSPHIPTPTYLNGYVLIPRADSADIYNCDLEDPSSWTESNFITAEVFPDPISSLVRQNNSIVAFGANNIEFFYDNGANQATGTPLARNAAPFLQMGSPAPYAIGQNEKFCFFVGSSNSGGRSVWKLDGFQPTQIGNKAIDRILNLEGTAIESATSMLIRLVGHFFYILKLSTRTFVYDVDEDAWHEWTTISNSANVNHGIGGASAINTFYINQSSTILGGINVGNFFYSQAADIGNGQVYLLGASNGIISKFNESLYKDLSQYISCQFTTPIIDFDSYKRKFIHQVTLVGDLSDNTISLRWSDDDYQTYSNYKTLSLSSRPVFTRLGMTRRRNYDLNFTGDAPFRLEGIESLYSEGEA